MFIVLYGINNLGKSTQAKLLVERLEKSSQPTEYLKYPIYELAPTGPRLNQILRGGQAQAISEIELQTLYAQNRRDYQPQLEAKLASGIIIVAEDYTGTGIAWGMAKGASLDDLEAVNRGLRQEDLGILLEGKRFLEGKEQTHLHESNDVLMERCRLTHRELADRYGWKKVQANQPIEKVAEAIWKIVQTLD